MNEVIDNLLPYQPNTDALAEVRVDTNNFSAEYGNVAGAVIGSTIKSGTNEFHGSAFEYWRDSSMAANSWDNNRVVPAAKKAELSQHIFGATLGGPLIKNKLFFFGDFQGFIRDRPGELVRSVAPEAWRRGDFSGVGRDHHRSPDGPALPGEPDSAEPVQPDRAVGSLQPDALSAVPTVPETPNNYVSRFVGQDPDLPGRRRSWTGTPRPRTACSCAGRTSSYTSEPERAPLPSQAGRHRTNSPFLGLGGNWTRTVSANAVNELLLGYTKVKFETGERTDWAGIGDANATIGIPGGQAIPGLSGFNIGNYGFGSNGIQEFNDIKTYQVTEKFSLFKGRHAFKFGGRWLHSSQGFSYSGNEGVLGHFNYTGAFTGFAFSDFLLDRVAQKGKGGDTAPFTQLQDRIGIFAQDDFRVRNNLTLNIGLSWEYTSPLVEKDDRQINIDLTTGQILQAGKNGASRALYDAYYGGFEPRVGFAWTPSEKWVVRGAFGIVQYMEGTGKNLRLPANPPYFTEGQRSFDATTGAGTAAIGFADVVQVGGGPSTLYRDLRPGPAAPVHEAVEPLRGAEADRLALGPGRVRRQPLEPHGRALRLQPAQPRERRSFDLGAAPAAAAALPAQPRTSAPPAAPTRSASAPTTPCRSACVSARRGAWSSSPPTPTARR